MSPRSSLELRLARRPEPGNQLAGKSHQGPDPARKKTLCVLRRDRVDLLLER